METPSQFRLPPPPNYLNSSIYQQAYIEGVGLVFVCSGTRTDNSIATGGLLKLHVFLFFF